MYNIIPLYILVAFTVRQKRIYFKSTKFTLLSGKHANNVRKNTEFWDFEQNSFE